MWFFVVLYGYVVICSKTNHNELGLWLMKKLH